MNPLKVGIIADYNPKNRYHLATDDAIAHAAKALSLNVQTLWLDTDQLDKPGAEDQLRKCDALFGGTSSPYRSMDGALRGIRFAREQGYPFIGT